MEPYSSSEPYANFPEIEGRNIVIKAPSEYIQRFQTQIPIIDDSYDSLLNLTGIAPFEGEKITILFDPTLPSNFYGALADNPIRVSMSE